MLFIGFLFFLLLPGFAQTAQKQHHLPATYENNLELFFSWRTSLNKSLGLADLSQTGDSVHFRYWANGHVIDIWSLDGKRYRGNILCYIGSHVPIDSLRKNPSLQQIFYASMPIRQNSLKRMVPSWEFIKNLAPQDSFPQWSLCTGPLAQFEISDARNYSFKQYHCPWYNEDVPEAKTVHETIQQMDSLARRHRAFEKMYRRLPPGTYTNDVYREEIVKP